MDLRIDPIPDRPGELECARSRLFTEETHPLRLTEATALRMGLLERSHGARGRASDDGMSETEGQRRWRQARSAKERERVDGRLPERVCQRNVHDRLLSPHFAIPRHSHSRRIVIRTLRLALR